MMYAYSFTWSVGLKFFYGWKMLWQGLNMNYSDYSSHVQQLKHKQTNVREDQADEKSASLPPHTPCSQTEC